MCLHSCVCADILQKLRKVDDRFPSTLAAGSHSSGDGVILGLGMDFPGLMARMRHDGYIRPLKPQEIAAVAGGAGEGDGKERKTAVYTLGEKFYYDLGLLLVGVWEMICMYTSLIGISKLLKSYYCTISESQEELAVLLHSDMRDTIRELVL